MAVGYAVSNGRLQTPGFGARTTCYGCRRDLDHPVGEDVRCLKCDGIRRPKARRRQVRR